MPWRQSGASGARLWRLWRKSSHSKMLLAADALRQVEGLRSQKKDLHLAAARFAVEQVTPRP